MKTPTTSKNRVADAWRDVRPALLTQSAAQLLEVVRDLYDLSPENRAFVNARYCAPDSEDRFAPYKKAINESLYPDVYHDKPIRIAVAKKAVSQYIKASNDEAGALELMVYFVECGNRFTVEFGDVDDAFYSALESMFGRVLKKLKISTPVITERFLPRLVAIRDAAHNIGWGYYEYLRDALAEAFPECE